MGIDIKVIPQMKYIKEYIPPYCLFGLEEIENMFNFYEDDTKIENFDDQEIWELKTRTKQKAKMGNDISLWR